MVKIQLFLIAVLFHNINAFRWEEKNDPNEKFHVKSDNDLFEESFNQCHMSHDDIPHLRCAALLSNGVYLRTNSVLCSEFNYNMVMPGKTMADGTSYCQVHKDGEGNYILAYRGTEVMERDLPKDFDVIPTRLIGHDAYVHRGFYKKNGDPCEMFMRDEFNAKKVVNSILVTGHSYGGAIGLIKAVELAYEYNRLLKHKVNVITFGQPKVGDRKFCQIVHSELNYYRIKRESDLVPGFPGVYKHCNHMVINIRGGRCSCNDSEFGVNRSIEDHSMESYKKDILGCFKPE
jgi:hypothetical protein